MTVNTLANKTVRMIARILPVISIAAILAGCTPASPVPTVRALPTIAPAIPTVSTITVSAVPSTIPISTTPLISVNTTVNTPARSATVLSTPGPPTIALPTRDGTTTTNSSAGNDAAADNSSDPRVRAVLDFLTAKAAGDQDTLSGLICIAQEAELDAQALSFAGYGARVENAVCSITAEDIVTCTGQIAANYNGEARNFPLGSYAVVEERGVWKWCGEQ